MLVTYEGIVIGRRDVGDSGCFIDILTDEQGIVEAKAYGVKKINSSIMGAAEMFSYSQFCMSKSNLRYTVNSAKPKYSFHDLGNDIEKLALASYFAQAIKFCIASEQAQNSDRKDSMVRFLAIVLYEVMNSGSSGRSLDAIKAGFELRFCRELGFAPNLIACDCCGEYDCEEGMYFIPDKAKLVCGECIGGYMNRRSQNLQNFPVAKPILLSPELLYALRCAVFAPLDRFCRFPLTEQGAVVMGRICENYFLDKAEQSFSALDYYKSLKI